MGSDDAIINAVVAIQVQLAIDEVNRAEEEAHSRRVSEQSRAIIREPLSSEALRQRKVRRRISLDDE